MKTRFGFSMLFVTLALVLSGAATAFCQDFATCQNSGVCQDYYTIASNWTFNPSDHSYTIPLIYPYCIRHVGINLSNNASIFNILQGDDSSGRGNCPDEPIGQIQLLPGTNVTFTQASTGVSFVVAECDSYLPRDSYNGVVWIKGFPINMVSRPNVSSNTCSGYDTLSVGQSEDNPYFQVQLTDISSVSGSPAMFDVISKGNPIGQAGVIGHVQVSPGSSYLFPFVAAGGWANISVCQTQAGSSNDQKKAWVRVTYDLSDALCSGFTRLQPGQSLNSGAFDVRFKQVLDNYAASFDVLSGGSVIGQVSVSPNSTSTFTQSGTGNQVQVQLCSAVVLTSTDQRAWIKTCSSGFTGLSIGQTLSSNGPLKVRLADVSVAVGSSTTHPAILDVLNANNEVIGQVQVSQGSTYTYTDSSTGETLQIQVCQTAGGLGGLTSSVKWAFVKLSYAPGTQNTCSGYTMKTAGQILGTGGYQLRLDDISTANGNPAIFSVHYPDGSVISQFQVSPGTSYRYSAPDQNLLIVNLCGTQPGLSLDSKKAWFMVAWSAPNANQCTGVTTYGIGQSAYAGSFQVRLDNVSFYGNHPATFSILQNGAIVGQAQANPGTTYTYSQAGTSEQVSIHVCAAEPDATPNSKWAQFTVSSEPTTNQPVSSALVRSNPGAKVVIQEFGELVVDPYTRQVEPTILKLLQNYPGQIDLQFNEFVIHPTAQKASEAAECARDQGKFWEYHDMLLASSQTLEVSDLKSEARVLGMNGVQFDACLDAGTKTAVVQKHKDYGASLGVQGSPGFMINGKLLMGAQPYETFDAAVQAALASSGTGPAPPAQVVPAPTLVVPVPPMPLNTVSIQLHKGWNLVSLGGTPSRLDISSADSSHKLLGFVYLQDEQRYVSILQAQQTLGSNFADYIGQHSFWIYSYSDTALQAQIDSPIAPEQIGLSSGWNFVPVTDSMLGQSVSQISLSCQVQKAYGWNAANQNWNSLDSSQPLSSVYQHEGMVIKVAQACTLGSIAPPSLPG